MNRKFSCLVDDHPKFIHQSILWLQSLLNRGGAVPDEIVFHVVEGIDSNYVSMLEERNVHVEVVSSFGKGNAVYCNKLQQLHSTIFDDADQIILCDTDLFFVDDITPHLNITGKVAAKIVDQPCPPLNILETLFQASGIEIKPQLLPVDFQSDEKTFYSNCNGGFYIFTKDGFQTIREPWIKWANWCLGKEEILGKYTKHADQLGFCFAVMETGLELEHLPNTLNFPTHFSKRTYQKKKIELPPKVLHYHAELTPNLQLKEIGIPVVDQVIKEANLDIHEMHRNDFSNKLFWNFRYKENPELGSGVGSRGEVLEYKRKLIYPFLNYFKEKDTLDVGCGDLELMRMAPSEKFTGIDISKEAIEICRKKRPDWNFLVGGLEMLNGRKYDLVTCFDVLIHQPTETAYRQFIEELTNSTASTMIIGAYDQEPKHSSSITFFYEPIVETLKKDGNFKDIQKIGEYRDVSVIMARRKCASNQNPSDLSFADLCILSEQCEHPLLLAELIDLSRETLGFFPKTSIRAFEYPWVISETVSRFEKMEGLNVTDIGAGVNVVPLWLSRAGARVTTIDPHPLTRELEDKVKWNEWGFLDYSSISDGKIVSLNKDASTIKLPEQQDLIYSVSVIEHLPAKIRRAILANCCRLLKDEGVLLLTVDLVPNTNKLWNLSEGKKVEMAWLHGTFKSLLNEIEQHGFEIIASHTQRKIYESRTDVAYIIAKKKST